jgi:hypothetical protein
MGSKVALVAFDENNAQESFERALRLVGGISDLNTAKRSVVIKVGVFDPRAMKTLTREGFFRLPNKRAGTDVAKAFEAKGLVTRGKEDNISRILALRAKRGILKAEKSQDKWFYWTE